MIYRNRCFQSGCHPFHRSGDSGSGSLSLGSPTTAAWLHCLLHICLLGCSRFPGHGCGQARRSHDPITTISILPRSASPASFGWVIEVLSGHHVPAASQPGGACLSHHQVGFGPTPCGIASSS